MSNLNNDTLFNKSEALIGKNVEVKLKSGEVFQATLVALMGSSVTGQQGIKFADDQSREQTIPIHNIVSLVEA